LAGAAAELALRADRDDVLGDVLLRDDARVTHTLLERRNAVLEQHLLVLCVVVFRVLRNVAELPCDSNPLGNLAALGRRELLDLLLEPLVPLRCEDDFLHGLRPLLMKKARRRGAVAGAYGSDTR